MLTDPRKRGLAFVAMLVGLACGTLVCLAEWQNVPGGTDTAERVFIFFFGAVHLVVAVIVTLFRRTAT